MTHLWTWQELSVCSLLLNKVKEISSVLSAQARVENVANTCNSQLWGEWLKRVRSLDNIVSLCPKEMKEEKTLKIQKIRINNSIYHVLGSFPKCILKLVHGTKETYTIFLCSVIQKLAWLIFMPLFIHIHKHTHTILNWIWISMGTTQAFVVP